MTNKIAFYKYQISAAKICVISLRKAHGIKGKTSQVYHDLWLMAKRKFSNGEKNNKKHLQAISCIIKYSDIKKKLPNSILRY